MKKLLLIVLAVCFICTAGVISASAVETTSAQVSSGEGFQQALDNPAISAIFLQGSFSIDSPLELAVSRKLTISSVTNSTVTLYQNAPDTRHMLLYIYDGISTDITFTDIIFDGKGVGGGIFSSRGDTITFNNCQFRNNYASHIGGGLYFAGYGTVNLNGCEISDNTAYGGGGIAVDNGVTLNMLGSTIKNNTANLGGGMWVGCGPKVNINGSTITGNSACIGGGVYILCDSDHGTTFNNNGTIVGNSLNPFKHSFKIGNTIIPKGDLFYDSTADNIFDYGNQ